MNFKKKLFKTFRFSRKLINMDVPNKDENRPQKTRKNRWSSKKNQKKTPGNSARFRGAVPGHPPGGAELPGFHDGYSATSNHRDPLGWSTTIHRASHMPDEWLPQGRLQKHNGLKICKHLFEGSWKIAILMGKSRAWQMLQHCRWTKQTLAGDMLLISLTPRWIKTKLPIFNCFLPILSASDNITVQ